MTIEDRQTPVDDRQMRIEADKRGLTIVQMAIEDHQTSIDGRQTPIED
jgi:hypothetical protein